jgi:AcrR family transcriptional regulator
MAEDSEQTPRRGSYAKGIARRQEILDRAIEVFAARGSDRTSLRAIAREVGVTHAALTHYFGSLEELLVAVYVESARPDPHAADAEDAPSGPVERMIEAARINREIPGLVQLYSSLVASALEENHPAAHAFATERFARIREQTAEEIREQQQHGTIRADIDPEAAAALIIAASDGLQTQWLLDDTAPQHEGLALLAQLLRREPGH